MPQIKVLLIDDEKEFTSIFVERLQLRGIEAEAVNSAEEAFDFVRKSPPDVILLDLRIPGMNGMEILKILREFDPNIEIIMVSGHSGLDRVEFIKLGAYDFLMKPVDINVVVEKIEQAFKKRSIGNKYLSDRKI